MSCLHNLAHGPPPTGNEAESDIARSRLRHASFNQRDWGRLDTACIFAATMRSDNQSKTPTRPEFKLPVPPGRHALSTMEKANVQRPSISQSGCWQQMRIDTIRDCRNGFDPRPTSQTG